jgi:VanZ family protein
VDAPLNRRILALLCLATVVGFYLVGLWPFNFWPDNNIQWISGGPGVYFTRHSIIYSQRPLILDPTRGAGDRAASFSIELWLQAESEPGSGVPHILSLYDGELPENLVIGQWKSELLVRAPIPDRSRGRGYREIGIAAALKKGMIRFITIASDISGTAFYLDGVLIRRYAKYVLPSSLLSGQVVLGNSVTGSGAWKGNLFGAAIFDKALSAAEVLDHYGAWIGKTPQRLATEPGLAALYLFDEGSGRWITDRSKSRLDLQIPQKYHVLRKTVLLPPWSDSLLNLSHAEDITINILGFVPLGFLLFLYRDSVYRRHRIINALLTVLIGTAVSISIELIQVYLPSRSSSATDLLCNMIGTMLGVLLVFVSCREVRARHAGQGTS